MISLSNLQGSLMAEQILFAFNFFLCLVGGFICVCRLRFIKSSTKRPIRWHYVMWLTMFGMSAMSWWLFGDQPTVGQFLLGTAAVGQLMLGANAWKNGAPAYSQKDLGMLVDRRRA